MGWFTNQNIADSIDFPDLPRRVLRHLIMSHGVTVGSHVLVVGSGDSKLVKYFDQLCLVVNGVDESGPHIATASRERTRVGDDHRPTKPIDLPDDHFDLVIVRGLAVYDNSLFDPAAFRQTAQLLSTVRSGGYLVFLTPRAASVHSASCFSRHLAQFPGVCHVSDFPDGIAQTETWWRLLHWQTRDGFVTASIQVPQRRLPRDDWSQLAEIAAHGYETPCCGAQDASQPRSAA